MHDLWSPNTSYVRAILKDVQTEAQIGLHPWERHPERPTRLLVNVEMFAHGNAFLNYDPVRAALRAWPGRPHTRTCWRRWQRRSWPCVSPIRWWRRAACPC